MVNFCNVPACSSRSDRETSLSFHKLPLSNKPLLKKWIHQIGRKDLPINNNTRVCSRHFVNSHGRVLRPDEFPTENLPRLPTQVSISTPRRPLIRKPVLKKSTPIKLNSRDVGINTDHDRDEVAILTGKINELEKELLVLNERAGTVTVQSIHLRVTQIENDDTKVSFYTGFPSYKHFKACFDFLGPAVDHLEYRDSLKVLPKSKKGRPRSLSPIDEFFLTLVRLRLGLLEQDLAYRFGISQSTVSRIFTTWINFIYIQFKQLPIWPPKEIINAYMPQPFKDLYPTIRIIIDATEVYVQKSSLPELQQRTFSMYKNHNTYKGLIGISPSGAVIFISKLYPGSISDKELTRQSGLLDLLQAGDSVMADRGFDISDDLALRGISLNIPPFLRGKSQLSNGELVQTRRIASLRIHVERSMERLKNYHIFDGVLPLSLMDVTDQMFFVCAVLTNFHPPLCV